MNKETQELLHRLELATSPSSVDPSMLDDETTTMRENWLALSQLLKTAEDLPRPEVVVLRCPVVSKRRSWLWALSCVASVVAALIVWLCLPKQNANLPQREITHSGTAHSGTAHDAPLDGNRSNPSPSGPQLAVSELAWDDDDWEQSFSETAGVLQRFHDAPRSHDLSLSQLQNDFQEFALEFETGSL